MGAEDILAEVGALSIADNPNLDIVNREKSYFQWNIKFSQIMVKERLGGGDMGECNRGFWNEKQVVVKKLKHPFANDSDLDLFREEVSLLVTVNHPNLTKFYGLTQHEHLHTVTEHVTGAVMANYIRNPSFGEDLGTSKDVLKWAREIAEAMNYLHVRGIIFRGLNPRNIIFDRSMSCKLRDYGMTEVKNEMRRRKIVSLADIPYSAPELLLNRG